MGVEEPHHAAQSPKCLRFQYSLRSLFVLTFATAVFFSVARCLGYADAILIFGGIAVLAGILRYPPRAHPVTCVLATLVAATLLWVNLRPNDYQRRFGNRLESGQTDVLTEAMFFRGWPICPATICLGNLSHYHDPEIPGLFALVIDGAVFLGALLAVRVSESFVRQRQ